MAFSRAKGEKRSLLALGVAECPIDFMVRSKGWTCPRSAFFFLSLDDEDDELMNLDSDEHDWLTKSQVRQPCGLCSPLRSGSAHASQRVDVQHYQEGMGTGTGGSIDRLLGCLKTVWKGERAEQGGAQNASQMDGKFGRELGLDWTGSFPIAPHLTSPLKLSGLLTILFSSSSHFSSCLPPFSSLALSRFPFPLLG